MSWLQPSQAKHKVVQQMHSAICGIFPQSSCTSCSSDAANLFCCTLNAGALTWHQHCDYCLQIVKALQYNIIVIGK